MTISRGRRARAFRPLEPSHAHRVQSMQVSEHLFLGPLASEYDDSAPGQNCTVQVASLGGRPRYLLLLPTVRVHVQTVCVVQVHVPFLLPSVVMSSEKYYRSS